MDDLKHLLEPQPRTIEIRYSHIVSAALGIAVGMVLITALKYCDKPPQPALDCAGCHRKMSFTEYFRKNGSKSPEELAHGILQTRNPKLLAAIAVCESNGNPTKRNTGRGGKYNGAFQTGAQWGKIRTRNLTQHDITHQALVAELALETHISEQKDIIKALNNYGGDKTKKQYAYKILEELKNVP